MRSRRALPRITTTNADAGRRIEWGSNANAYAVVASDRNTGPDATDAHVQSLWADTPGNWTGGVVWGDGHVTWEPSNILSTSTSYNNIITTGDNLFADRPAPGVTEHAGNATANAMMTMTN